MNFAGRSIPDPGFAGDDGTAPAALRDALAAASRGGASHSAAEATADADRSVLAALVATRLLVPVVAVLDELEEAAPGELAREKSSDMAVPTITRRDGRRALPAFTSVDALVTWRADARPVPVPASRAALAALAENADTLLLDLAGPHPHEITGARLRALAEGRELRPAHDDPEVADAVRHALVGEPAVAAAYLVAGPTGDLTLLLEAAGPPVEVTPAARRIAGRLAETEVLRAALRHGLDLSLLPPGAAVPAAERLVAATG